MEEYDLYDFKACVLYFLKINYTSDLITYMKLQYKQCLPVFALPENQNFYVAMADASSTFIASG